LKDKDEESRNKLIEHNLRLVAHIVKKYDIKKEQVEDLISIGTIGLIKAVDSFKPEKGHKLTTYASRCIENEILMYLRSSKNYFQNVSLNDPIATDKDGSEITLIDAIASPEDSTVIDEMMKKDRIARLKEYIHILDEREMEIITKRFGLYGEEEKTQREIARQLHISRSYVSRIEKRAFMKLYREFQKEEKRKERSLKSS
ncbi:MAG: RNA polymerase sporulation sigma factor SigK, partial [Clostridium sp.]